MKPNRPLREQLFRILALSLGVGLAIVFVFNTLSMFNQERESKLSELRSMAELMAFNASAVVDFGDARGAEKLFSALDRYEDIDSGHLIAASSSFRHHYHRPGGAELAIADDTKALPLEGLSESNLSHIAVVVPVLADNRSVGSLHLSASLSGLWLRVLYQAGLFLLAALAAFVLAVLYGRNMLQRILVRLGDLTATAQQVGRSKDFSKRANQHDSDEIGRLAGAFNLMLAEIENRDLDLARSREQLGQDNAALAEEIRRREQLEEELTRNAAHLEDLAEEARLSANQAEEATRSKTDFLATMSHEIRTPMNGILGMAQILLMRETTEEERQQSARTIMNAGQTLLTLLNDILDLSKVEAGKLKLEHSEFSAVDLLRETVQLFAEPARAKSLKLRTGLPMTASMHYRSDPTRLRQMLSNLIGNAIKFTPRGEVFATVQEVRSEGNQAVLEFSVIDTGIGIEHDKLDLLFRPFSQVDSSTTREFGGTGLGLSIVRRLAGLMGGEAGVSSKPGQGSRFWFRVRAEKLDEQESALAKAQSADTENLDPSKLPRFTGSILLAEDHQLNRQLIKVILDKFGLTATTAEDGLQAVELATSGETYDLILMDLRMPNMDGFEATRQIRAWQKKHGHPTPPIIAVTANVFEDDKRRSLEAGMNGFLAKPIILKDMADTLARWLPRLERPDARSPVAAPSREVDAAEATRLLDVLLPQIENNLFDAIPAFKALRELLADTALDETVKQAERLLEALNFQGAAAVLRQMAQTHAWKLSV